MKYAQSFYAGEELVDLAKQYRAKLPRDVTMLVSAGSSGMAIASALLMLRPKLRNHFIRREGESVHSYWGGVLPSSSDVLCFVDDFISRGETVRRVIAYFNKTHGNLLLKIKYFLVNYIDIAFEKRNEFLLEIGGKLIEVEGKRDEKD